jgi:hypothetical protein
MKYVYLDWNIFNQIEKNNNSNKEQIDVYNKIETLIASKEIICPYSNAHINDLLRGYYINPVFIPKHLETLTRLTNNLCIVQYWGKEEAIWHYRNATEFFNSALEESVIPSKSFTELMKFDETGLLRKAIELIPFPKDFDKIYNADPIFPLMFPKTKEQMTMMALCEDLYDFSKNAKKDYTLYKSLRRYFNENKNKLGAHHGIIDVVGNISETPNHLNSDTIWEKYAGKTKVSDNNLYQIITDTYCKIDFRGYKSDEKFSNLIDDSLHVFYGAYCDFFITIDDKCQYKAIETYKKLDIPTKALKPNEFLTLIE